MNAATSPCDKWHAGIGSHTVLMTYISDHTYISDRKNHMATIPPFLTPCFVM